MIFYTSDLHLFSEKTAAKRSGVFSSAQEMNDRIVENWNRRVGKEDTVWLLGDICDHGTALPVSLLASLRGHKHLVRGNHDTGIEEAERLFAFFETVTDYTETDDGSFHITLCHYPLVYLRSGYMIHGHLHRPEGASLQILRQMPRVLNAAGDINGFAPVTLPELIENNGRYYGVRKEAEHTGGEKRGKWKADFRPLPVRSGENV